jgi:hypothetical protein
MVGAMTTRTKAAEKAAPPPPELTTGKIKISSQDTRPAYSNISASKIIQK